MTPLVRNPHWGGFNIHLVAVEVPKKRLVKRRLYIVHSCNRCFRETGLALVVILRCNWPMCDLRFKSYKHFKSKIFLSRNLIYLTAKILRTVHWKCTPQIKTPAEFQNVNFLPRPNLSNLYPKKSEYVAANLPLKLNEIAMNAHFWVEKAENSMTYSWQNLIKVGRICPKNAKMRRIYIGRYRAV